MKRDFKYISRFSLAGLFLLIFSAHYIGSTMFPHKHVLQGETIFHSHFSTAEHRSDGSSDGGHTYQVAKLIAHLSQIAVEEQSFACHIERIEAPIIYVIEPQVEAKVECHAARHRSLRAPPVVVA